MGLRIFFKGKAKAVRNYIQKETMIHAGLTCEEYIKCRAREIKACAKIQAAKAQLEKEKNS